MDGDLRFCFLAASGVARDVVAHEAVGAAWWEASALRELTVGGLCAHLVRATLVVADYLGAPEPAGAAITAAQYFAAIDGADIDNHLNVGVRRRGEELAATGRTAVLAALDQARERLTEELPLQPPDRCLRVGGGVAIGLDDYIETRLVELTIHVDDVCMSVGMATPAVPGAEVAIRVLVDAARARHGDVEVLRALARRERDSGDVLRVL